MQHKRTRATWRSSKGKYILCALILLFISFSMSVAALSAPATAHAPFAGPSAPSARFNLQPDSAASSLRQASPTPPLSLDFTHITTQQGLSSNTEQVTVQDHEGFIWIASTNGLNRYSGADMLIFQNDPADPTTLSDNFVRSLFVDNSGKLWVGTNGGLNSYDRATNRFTVYRHDDANPTSLSADVVRAIYQDRAGTMWIGTDGGGLNKLDLATGVFTTYRHDPANPRSISNDSVRDILQDQDGNLWVATFGGGLNRIDPASGQFSTYRHDPANPRSISGDFVQKLVQDPSGDLWIGTWEGGLNRFDPGSESFTAYLHDPTDPASLNDNRVMALCLDNSGALWVGTYAGGVSIFDADRGGFVAYLANNSHVSSLSGNRVFDIFQDRSGLMWVTVQGDGVNLYNPQQQSFKVYRNNPGDPNSLADNVVYTTYQDHNGIIWAGTADAGLERLDPLTGQVTHYPPDPSNPQKLGHPTVFGITGDGKDGLWIATYGGGLYHLDPATGIFTGYHNDPADPRSLSDDSLNGIARDQKGGLWLSTLTGLAHFDPASGVFTAYRNDPSNAHSLTPGEMIGVTVAGDGTVWISGYSGLNHLDPISGQVTRYENEPLDPKSLSNSFIMKVYEDPVGTTWAAGFDGVLNRFDPQSGGFDHFLQNSKAPAENIGSMLGEQIDGKPTGNLWIWRNNSLVKFDTRSGQYQIYTIANGLPYVQATRGGSLGNNGELLLGSRGELIIVDPAKVRIDPTPPPIVFTDFLLGNKQVPIDGSSVLTQSIDKTDSIQLSYEDRVISFGFSALDFRSPQQVRYRYRLEGFDSDWTEVGSTQRLVTYTNLDSGPYVFMVTAANADGVWNTTGRTINLIITPPWWETMEVRLVALALVAALLYAIYRWRTRSLRQEQRRLETGIAVATADLSQATEHLRFQAHLLDKVENAVIAIDPDERISFANAYAEHLYGWPVDEMIGRPVGELRLTEMSDEQRTSMLDQLRTGKSWTGEMTGRRRNGGRFAVLGSTAPIHDENGQLTGMLGVSVDISELKRVEEAVNQANLALRQRVDELSTLNNIAETLGTVAELPDALALVGRNMLDIFGADGISFCVLDANRNEIRSISNTGRVLLPLQRVYQAVPVDSVPFAAGALQSREVMIGIPDPPAGTSDGQETVAVAYLMLLPLRAHSEITGLMALVSTEHGKVFSPDQVVLAETIAGLVATAIETNRLFIEEQQQRQAAESLREVVAVLSSSLDVDTVFERVFNQLHRVVTFDTAAIWLVDGDELTLAESVGLARLGPHRRILLVDDVPPVRVLRQEQPILIPTVEPDGHWPTLVDAARSWLGAPLTAGEQVIGVLTVAHHAPGNYDEGDLATLAVFAAQAAIAIDNATRYRRAHVEGADEERQRLARELHDSVTQALFSASLVADVLPVIWARSTAEGEETLATLRRMTRSALAEMRTLLLELRPDALAQAQLDTIVETLITATGSQQFLEISQRLDRTPLLPAEVQIALYRIVQEALNNIVKHAQAKSLQVELTVTPPVTAQDRKEWCGRVTITVADDGRGFNPEEISSDHLGLVIMSERMSSIGGKLTVKSAPGEGTCITVTWSNADG